MALWRHSGGFDAGSLELLTLSPLQRSRVPDQVDDNDDKGNKMEDVAQSKAPPPATRCRSQSSQQIHVSGVQGMARPIHHSTFGFARSTPRESLAISEEWWILQRLALKLACKRHLMPSLSCSDVKTAGGRAEDFWRLQGGRFYFLCSMLEAAVFLHQRCREDVDDRRSRPSRPSRGRYWDGRCSCFVLH